MMFTHEQLLKAVKKAGRNGQPFTCAAVRESLGLSTRDKKQLSRFHTEFRALLRSAPEVFEKVGKNAYQLKLVAAPEQPAALEVIEQLPEPIVQRAEPIEESREIEIAAAAELFDPAPVLESLEVPLQLIEVDFDVQEVAAEAPDDTQRVEELIRKDVPQPTIARSWLDRGGWLGRRVAEFFGRS